MFYSILFPDRRRDEPRLTEAPEYFRDLNLDQIVSAITNGRGRFELEPFFYTPLRETETIVYRQEVMRDLDDPGLLDRIKAFADSVFNLQARMMSVSQNLSESHGFGDNYLTRGRCLDAAQHYCEVLNLFVAQVRREALTSTGLRGFYDYVQTYTESERVQALWADIRNMRQKLSSVEYCMLIRNGTIKVRKFEQQEDHTRQISAVFEKFRQGDCKDFRHKLTDEPYADHVEAAVLDMLSVWYKDVFDDLKQFCTKNLGFMDETILRFCREVQFYLAYQEYVRPFQSIGLRFCYPQVCTEKEHIFSREGFDLALACSLLPDRAPVTNDFWLDAPERIIVVTGPNQGGKTTFARTLGQLHHLACIGCAVPGTAARLYLFDWIYCHFGREEDLSTLSGKLQDDLMRFHGILDKATDRSIIILNEVFSSATLEDALSLAEQLMTRIVCLGAIAVYVTFMDEIASLGPETVSMMSTVQKDDPAERTYKILRQEADGLAYAIHIAEKYGLTYESLSRRLRP